MRSTSISFLLFPSRAALPSRIRRSSVFATPCGTASPAVPSRWPSYCPSIRSARLVEVARWHAYGPALVVTAESNCIPRADGAVDYRDRPLSPRLPVSLHKCILLLGQRVHEQLCPQYSTAPVCPYLTGSSFEK